MARKMGKGNNPPNPSTLLSTLKADKRLSGYGVTADEALGMYDLMGPRYKKAAPISPMSSLPTAAQSGEFTQATQIFGNTAESLDYYQPYNDYTGVNFQSKGNAEAIGYDDATEREAPAPLSIVPTSTSNPDRPRTIAAGYIAYKESGSGTLTVVFRDGTYYNYYGVTQHEWTGFKAATSKGRYISAHLDQKDRGPADVSFIDAGVMEVLHKVSRSSQRLRANNKGRYKQQISRHSKKQMYK